MSPEQWAPGVQFAVTGQDWVTWASGVQSLVTAASLVIGGIWVYLRYVRQQERYPNLEFTADINFVGPQAGWWIVELVALVENKGKGQHRMNDLVFDLKALRPNDPLELNSIYGNQVDFLHLVAEGSFRPQQSVERLEG